MKSSGTNKLSLRRMQILVALSLAALGVGCAYTPGVSVPIQHGDIGRGRQAFIDHQCHGCHSVAGVNLPALAGAGPVQLELGGQVVAVRSYGELLTSIINPNHVVSEDYRRQLQLEATVPLDSPMPTPHIDTMSVRQLIDLVAFLDSRYVLIEEYDSGT